MPLDQCSTVGSRGASYRSIGGAPDEYSCAKAQADRVALRLCQLPQDLPYMHRRTVHMREVRVALIEQQCQIRPGQKNRVDCMAAHEVICESRELFVFLR